MTTEEMFGTIIEKIGEIEKYQKMMIYDQIKINREIQRIRRRLEALEEETSINALIVEMKAKGII